MSAPSHRGDQEDWGGQGEVRVAELLGPDLDDLDLRVLAGESFLDNRIINPRVQKPGLAFAGYSPYVKPGRVQIIGASETAYLHAVRGDMRQRRFKQITALPIPVFVITKGLPALPGFLEACQAEGVAVLGSTALSSKVIDRVSFFLEEHLVPSTCVHGVLLEVYGLGVLLLGESGVGKSESALDLITRGHSLVADDKVDVKLYPKGDLVGYCDGPFRHRMELRGLGIINVQDLFGLAAVRERKSIDLVIELEPWDEDREYDRLGLDETLFEILGVSCPYIRMPVALGRNIGILVEIAARNHVLKMQGHHSAREFARLLEQKLQSKAAGPQRKQTERPKQAEQAERRKRGGDGAGKT